MTREQTNCSATTEADTCREFVTPKLIEAGWSAGPFAIGEQRTFTNGRIFVAGGKVRRGKQRRADYILFYRRDLPLAVVEAKEAGLPVETGVQQARDYAQTLGLKFAYAANDHRIIEVDYLTGTEREVNCYAAPEELFARLTAGVLLPQAAAAHLLEPFNLASSKVPRYSQQIAIHRVVEAILLGQKRNLATLATGTGKTCVAFQICWTLWNSRYITCVPNVARTSAAFLAYYLLTEIGLEKNRRRVARHCRSKSHTEPWQSRQARSADTRSGFPSGVCSPSSAGSCPEGKAQRPPPSQRPAAARHAGAHLCDGTHRLRLTTWLEPPPAMATPKSKPSWADVKARLTELDRAGLLSLLQNLYAASKDNQLFLHARLHLDADPLKPYKATIDRWLWPDVFKHQDTSVAKAKKAIADYKKASGTAGGLAELMVFYCERASDFSGDVGMADETYLGAFERMFEQAVKAVTDLPPPQQTALSARLALVRDRSQDIGYGVDNTIAQLFAGQRGQ